MLGRRVRGPLSNPAYLFPSSAKRFGDAHGMPAVVAALKAKGAES